MRKSRGFTLAELAVAAGLSAMILGFLGYGAIWLRNSMKVMGQLEEDSALLLLPRLLYQEMDSTREFLVPAYHESREEQLPSHQVVMVDRQGDVLVLFVNQMNRLVQYSHKRQQFRDLYFGVSQFVARQVAEGVLHLEVFRESPNGMERISSVYEVQRLL
ncbi:MAG: prepilin-type N-terminal cleavage/methylation domain-containing protein [Candidatus Cloacimonetes bacterium]|nr:prepilin-type N-terminal cleavage/methylation domain-containing protein [Candidatus Cloacimonadota bacterium]